MIRPATLDDWPAVDAMLRRFAETRSEGYHTGTAHMSYRACIRSGFAIVADADGPCGVMLASLGQSWCSRRMMSEELAMWVNPEARGHWLRPMVDAYREWLAMVGARGAIACPDERLAKVLRRWGCTRLETMFEVN